MNLFISWSGEQSKRLATVLREFVPLMLQGTNPFMSRHDLESGTRWGQQLAAELELSNFGIICLTPDNLNSNWLMFEAGALTKLADGRACGLLFGDVSPSDISGPLSQFQHRNFDENGVKHLFDDLNGLCESPLGESQLNTIFDKFWPDLESECVTILQSTTPKTDAPVRQTADVLDDLVVAVRNLERRLSLFPNGGNESLGLVHQTLAHLDNEHIRPFASLITFRGERAQPTYDELIEGEGDYIKPVRPEVIQDLIELGLVRKVERNGEAHVEITHDAIAAAAVPFYQKVMREEDDSKTPHQQDGE